MPVEFQLMAIRDRCGTQAADPILQIPIIGKWDCQRPKVVGLETALHPIGEGDCK